MVTAARAPVVASARSNHFVGSTDVEPEVPTVSCFGTGYLLFYSGSGSEVAPEVPTCPVVPGRFPEVPTCRVVPGRFPEVPTEPWSVVPGLVPTYCMDQLINIWENHNLINIGSNFANDIPK